MDTPESIAIELTTDGVVIAGFGASTSTSTAAVPGASAPKIGTVSTVIIVHSGNGQYDGGMGAAQWEGDEREERWSTLGRRPVQVR
jgi:hypothetical protein